MSKPNYPECKRCGGEDCVCCEIWVDNHSSYEPDEDYDAHWLGDEDEYYDDDEECEDEE